MTQLKILDPERGPGADRGLPRGDVAPAWEGAELDLPAGVRGGVADRAQVGERAQLGDQRSPADPGCSRNRILPVVRTAMPKGALGFSRKRRQACRISAILCSRIKTTPPRGEPAAICSRTWLANRRSLVTRVSPVDWRRFSISTSGAAGISFRTQTASIPSSLASSTIEKGRFSSTNSFTRRPRAPIPRDGRHS